MSEASGVHSRTWRPAIALAILGVVVLAAIVFFVRRGAGQSVTPEALAAARKTWEKIGIDDYDLEWMASGRVTAHYYVTVRGSKVQKIESIAPDGRRFEVHPGEPRFYSVEGLFTTIADELAQLKEPEPFGQPKDTKVVMRFTPDPKLGYPVSYRRNVLGTTQGLAIDVIRLIPVKKGATG
ncbi:MAG: hypothetical protein ACP5XB_12405 [Isosphaeraceae bacterium]